jgi:hypothetical protein
LSADLGNGGLFVAANCCARDSFAGIGPLGGSPWLFLLLEPSVIVAFPDVDAFPFGVVEIKQILS